MALWVAFGHAFLDFAGIVHNHAGNFNAFSQQIYAQAFYAHFAVDAFIVISGFCLMLPVAKRDNFTLKGGWTLYLYRRAKRILPPYYCALLIALVMAGIRFWICAPNSESWYIQHIDFRPSAILAHVFLIQNMWDPWARAVDGPTWSVATEFQIYLLFPLILLPLWRRCSPLMVVCLGYGAGIGLMFWTFGGHRSGLTGCAWYVGLFAMGMAASQWHVLSRSAKPRPYLAVGAIALIVLVAVIIGTQTWNGFLMAYLDFAVGGAAACALAYFSSFEPGERRGMAMRILEWKPLVMVGAFSYSLYLIHAPLLNLPVTLLVKYKANGYVGGLVIICSLAGIIWLARLFYRYVELPSMTNRKQESVIR
jgi:peptidoglycan/LPS O-acetylase OafA/YrhL